MTVGAADLEVDDNDRLQNAIQDLETLAAFEPNLGLIGTRPDPKQPDLNGGYAFHEPTHIPLSGTAPNWRFREKPHPMELATLIIYGALLNIGEIVVRVGPLLRMYRKFLPDYYAYLERIAKARQPLDKIDAVASAYTYFANTPKLFAKDIIEQVSAHQEEGREFALAMKEASIAWTDLVQPRGSSAGV